MGKRKMTNWKKSGMRICLATLFLCISLSGQTYAADLSGMQTQGAADAGMTQDTGNDIIQNTGNGSIQDTENGMAQAAGNGMTPAANVQTVRAEAGVIEVQSGFVDTKGKFWCMKSGSGFLIANKESDTYIVTNCSSVSNTPNKIKKYCKKNEIDTENMQLTNAIRVVITGDVTAEAEVVVKSAEKDYCVLSAANVVSQKESLKLGDSTRIAVNDLVYAYGFPKQTDTQESTMEYSEMDVRSMQGAVVQTEAYRDSGIFLSHSAPVVQGMEGGPLMDADGYVIGMNCKQSPEDDTGVAYALPIQEISAVLDNFSIYYGSRAIDEAHGQLGAVYQECLGIQEAGGYKKDSMETLGQALEQAQEMLQKEEPGAQELLLTCQILSDAKDALVPKTEKITIAILALAVVDALLLIWMIILAVKNAEEKKLMEMRRLQPAPQGAGYGGTPQNAASARQPDPGYHSAAGRTPAAAAQLQQNTGANRRPVAPPAGRRLHMIRQKTGQAIVLNKNQFILGKSQALADFSIPDNQTISRKHAMLFEDNGGWYVDDLNSLNGTCVNGKKVIPGQPVRLQSGDEITLADEVFLVQD